MFAIKSGAIDPSPLASALQNPAAGAVVTFEGRVRNHHSGRAVLRLEYESYRELALTEGERLIEETVEKFGATKLLAAHRVGVLQIGELALWVGASSPHRQTAFAACEFFVDQLKLRVPIWKREHFAEGDAEWSQGAWPPRPESVGRLAWSF